MKLQDKQQQQQNELKNERKEMKKTKRRKKKLRKKKRNKTVAVRQKVFEGFAPPRENGTTRRRCTMGGTGN